MVSNNGIIKERIIFISGKLKSAKTASLLLTFSIIITGFQFLNFGFLTTFLNVEDFGLYRVFLSAISFSGVFHFGYVDGVTNRWVVDREMPFTGELIWVGLLSVITGIAVFFYNGVPGYTGYVYILFLLINVLAFINGVYLRNRIFFVPTAVLFVTQVVFAIFFFAKKENLEIALIMKLTIVINAFACLVLLAIALFSKGFIQRGLSFTKAYVSLTDRIRIGFPILLQGFFFVALFNIDKIILAPFFPKVQFGLYTFASSVVTVIAGVLLSLTGYVFTKFSGAKSSVENFSKLYHRLFLTLGLISLICLAMLPAIRFILIEYLPHYVEAGTPLSGYLFILFPALALQLLCTNAYKALKLTKGLLIFSVFYLAITGLFFACCLFFQVPLFKIPYACAGVLFFTLLIHEYLFSKLYGYTGTGLWHRLSLIVIFMLALLMIYLWQF